MTEREHGADFIEALARGLDVLRHFSPDKQVMSLSEVAKASSLATSLPDGSF